MAGPQDPAAASGDQLRAGQADREQVIDTLKTAFVQGRLTKDELELRVGQVLASLTYPELAAVTADLPAGLITANPAVSARERGGQRVLRPGPVISAATALYAVLWVYAAFFPKGADGPEIFVNLTFGGGFFYLIILAMCLGHMIASRRARRAQRSGHQAPRPPAARGGGWTSPPLPSADPGREPPPADGAQPHTAEATRNRLPHQQPSVSRRQPLPIPGTA